MWKKKVINYCRAAQKGINGISVDSQKKNYRVLEFDKNISKK